MEDAQLAQIARGIVDGSHPFDPSIEGRIFGTSDESLKIAYGERLALAILSELDEISRSKGAGGHGGKAWGKQAGTAAIAALWLLRGKACTEVNRLARHFVVAAEIASKGPEKSAKKAAKRATAFMRTHVDVADAILHAAKQQLSSTVALALVASIAPRGDLAAAELYVDRTLSLAISTDEKERIVALHEALKPLTLILDLEAQGPVLKKAAAPGWIDYFAMSRSDALNTTRPALVRALKRSPGSGKRVCELIAAAPDCQPADAAALSSAAASCQGETLCVFATLSRFQWNVVAAAVEALCGPESHIAPSPAASGFNLARALSALGSSKRRSTLDPYSRSAAVGAVRCLLMLKSEEALEALSVWVSWLDPASDIVADVAALASKELSHSKRLMPVLRLIAAIVEAWGSLLTEHVKASDLEAAALKVRKKAASAVSSVATECNKEHTLCLYSIAAVNAGKLDWAKDERLAFSTEGVLDVEDEQVLIAACGLIRLTKLKNCPGATQERAWAHVVAAVASQSEDVRDAAELSLQALVQNVHHDKAERVNRVGLGPFYKAMWLLVTRSECKLNLVAALRRVKGTNFVSKVEREYVALVIQHPRVTGGQVDFRQKLWQHIVKHAQLASNADVHDGQPIVAALTSGREDQVQAAALALETLYHTALYHSLAPSEYCPKAALDTLTSDLDSARAISTDDVNAYFGRIQKEEDAPKLFAVRSKANNLSSCTKAGPSGSANKSSMSKKKKETIVLGAPVVRKSNSGGSRSKPSPSSNPPQSSIAKQPAPTSFELIISAAAERAKSKATLAKSTMRAVQIVVESAPHMCTNVWPSFLPTVAETTALVAANLNSTFQTTEFDDIATDTCAAIYRASVLPKAPRYPRQAGRAVALTFALKQGPGGDANVNQQDRAVAHRQHWTADDSHTVTAALEDIAARSRGIVELTPFARLGSRVAWSALEQSAVARTRRPKPAIEVLRAMAPVLGMKARAAALKALIVTSARSGDDKEPAAAILSLCCHAPDVDAHVFIPPVMGLEHGPQSAVAPIGVFDYKPRVRCAVLAACLILASRCGAVFDIAQMVRVWIASFWFSDEKVNQEGEVRDDANLIDELSDVFADWKDLLPRDVFGCRGATTASGATVDAKARLLARVAWARMLDDHTPKARARSTTALLLEGEASVQIDSLKVPISDITSVALADGEERGCDVGNDDVEFEAVRAAARRALASIMAGSMAANADIVTKHLCQKFDLHRPANPSQQGVLFEDPEAHLMRPPGDDPIAEARERQARRAAEERKVAIDARRRVRVAKTLAMCLRQCDQVTAANLLAWVRARLGDPDTETREALLDVGTAIVDADVDSALDTLFTISQKFEEDSVIRLGLTALLGRAANSLGEGDSRIGDVADRLIAALTSTCESPALNKTSSRNSDASSSSAGKKLSVTKDYSKAAPVTGAAAISGMVGNARGVAKKVPLMNAQTAYAKRQAMALRASLTETSKRKAPAAELQRRQAEGILSESSLSAMASARKCDKGPFNQALVKADEAAQRAIADGLVPIAKSLKKDGERAGELVDRLAELCFGGRLEGSALRRKGAARGLAAAVKGFGIATLKQRGVVGKIEAALADESTIDDKHGGLVAVECLAERLGVLFEPYEIALLPSLLRCFGEGTELVREAAKASARKVFEGLSAHGVKLALPTLLNAAAGLSTESSTGGATHWRQRVAAISMLGTAAHCAPKQLGAVLPKAVPTLASALGDTHPKVREAARDALSDVGSVAKNPEIRALRSVLLEALSDPAHATRSALDALLSREFAHSLDAPSVALVAPVLQRGLRDRLAETKRLAAVVLGNLASMSSTSADAVAPHVSSLQPLLEVAAVCDAHPDVRLASSLSLAQLAGSLGISRLPFIIERLCNAALARRATRREVGDIIAVKADSDDALGNGGLLAGAVSGGSERSGAAQALAAVLRELGREAISDTFHSQIVPISRHCSPAGREGALCVVRYLSRAEDFESALVPEALAAILDGLADDADSVREAALFAGKQLVRSHGEKELAILLPSLESRLMAPTWRIRAAAATLIGEILYLIGDAKHVGFSERDAERDDALGDEATAAALERAIGKAAWRNIRASLYISRLDPVAAVRAAALDVWKTVVPSTPRALVDILATLVRRLVSMLVPDSGSFLDADAGRRRRQAEKEARHAKQDQLQLRAAAASRNQDRGRETSHEIGKDRDDEDEDEEDDDKAFFDGAAERQMVASRTLGDIVTKIGDRVIPELVPLLHETFDCGDQATRVGVCLGLAEVAAAASQRQALAHLGSLAPAVLRALLQPHGEEFNEIVIAHAAVAFHELHGTAGRPALEAIVPGILDSLEEVDGSEAGIIALREISRRRSREILSVVIPKLLALKPISSKRVRAANAIADVAGGQLGPHLGSIVRAFIADLVQQGSINEAEIGASASLLVACAGDVAASAAIAGDVSSVLGQMATPFASSQSAQRKCAAAIIAAFFEAVDRRTASRQNIECRAAINEACPRLLKEIILLLAEPDTTVRDEAVAALAAYSSTTPVVLQVDHLDFVRVTLSSTASDARLRLKRQVPIPGISEGPEGIAALLPLYLHALLHGTPEKRESAALGIAEIVDLSSELALKKHAVKIAGPLIRVIGDRFGAEVRVAIFIALEALLKKGPTLLKAFVPQLMATATKNIKDPVARNVRNRAFKLLELLVPFSTRIDPLVLDLTRAARDTQDDNEDLQLVLLRAAVSVVSRSGKTLSAPVMEEATDIAQILAAGTEGAIVTEASALCDALARNACTT